MLFLAFNLVMIALLNIVESITARERVPVAGFERIHHTGEDNLLSSTP
jgi:hypothetical protein